MQRKLYLESSICICKNGKYLQTIKDNSVIMCNETINATDSVSKNITSAVSTNFCNKKVKLNGLLYSVHVLLMIILLFITAVICYHYAKHRSKQKTYCCTNNTKMENNEFKKSVVKSCVLLLPWHN